MYLLVPESLSDGWAAFSLMLRAGYVECAYNPCYRVTLGILKSEDISSPSWLDRLDAAMQDADTLHVTAEQIALEWEAMHAHLCTELRPGRLPIAGADAADFETRALHYVEGSWAEPLVGNFLKILLKNAAPGVQVEAVERMAAKEKALMAEYTGILERAHVRYSTHYKLDELIADYGADSNIVVLRCEHDRMVQQDHGADMPGAYKDDILACLANVGERTRS